MRPNLVTGARVRNEAGTPRAPESNHHEGSSTRRHVDVVGARPRGPSRAAGNAARPRPRGGARRAHRSRARRVTSPRSGASSRRRARRLARGRRRGPTPSSGAVPGGRGSPPRGVRVRAVGLRRRRSCSEKRGRRARHDGPISSRRAGLFSAGPSLGARQGAGHAAVSAPLDRAWRERGAPQPETVGASVVSNDLPTSGRSLLTAVSLYRAGSVATCSCGAPIGMRLSGSGSTWPSGP